MSKLWLDVEGPGVWAHEYPADEVPVGSVGGWTPAGDYVVVPFVLEDDLVRTVADDSDTQARQGAARDEMGVDSITEALRRDAADRYGDKLSSNGVLAVVGTTACLDIVSAAPGIHAF